MTPGSEPGGGPLARQPRIGARVQIPAARVAGTIVWAAPLGAGGWKLGLKGDDGELLPPIAASQCVYVEDGASVCPPLLPARAEAARSPIDHARARAILRSARATAEGKNLRGPVQVQLRDYAGLCCDQFEILKGVVAGEPDALADALAIILGEPGS